MVIVSFCNRRWAEKRAEEQAKAWAKARSDEIDLYIEQESKSFKRQCNVLLISIPESEAAAAAFMRRMKTLHGGHSNDELATFTRENLACWKIFFQHLRSFVVAIRSRYLGPASRSNKAIYKYIINHLINADGPSRLSVDDNVAYFVSKAQQIVLEELAPSIDDIPNAAEKGIMETYFNMGRISIRVLQVYSQLSERKKWIHLFEGVTSIIFYASLSGYNESVAGWSKQTRLSESLVLFESVVNSRWFLRTSVILLLTDIAEFRTKLHEVPLAQYYQEYTGGADVNKGAKYILWRFMQCNRSRLNVYPHITEDSDMGNLRLLFVTVKETILQNALKASGIL